MYHRVVIHRSLLGCLLCLLGCKHVAAQIAIVPIALSGQQAPGLPAGIQFQYLDEVTLDTSGNVLFNSGLSGPGVTPPDSNGIWMGKSGAIDLLARGGDQAPGMAPGVTFYGLTRPLFHNVGEAIFSTLVAPTFDRGVWRGTPGDLKLVVRSGDPAPGTPAGVTFAGALDILASNGQGTSLIHAGLTGPSVTPDNDRGLWLLDRNGMTLVARNGDQAPGAPAGVRYSFNCCLERTIDATGRVAFTIDLAGPGVTTNNDTGIWQYEFGTTSLIAREGDPVPGGAPGERYVFLGVGPRPRLNANGQIAFQVDIAGPGVTPLNDQAVMFGTPGHLTVAARDGQNAIGTDGQFGRIKLPHLNDSGQVAFTGLLESPSGGSGIWVTDGNTMRMIAREGQLAPGSNGNVFSNFDAGDWGNIRLPIVNSSPQVMFRARLAAPGNSTPIGTGLWIDDGGLVTRIVGPGDVLAGRHVSGAFFNALDYAADTNGFGQTVFVARFVDGSTGLFLYSPPGIVPEPSTVVICALSLAQFVFGRRRFESHSIRKSSRQQQQFRLQRLAIESLEARQMLSVNDLAFGVVDDATANIAYWYEEAGASLGSSALVAANAAPRGVTSMIGVDKTWVIDANRKVFVYNESGGLLGSWTAGTMASNATPEGIATDGTNIWIVDSKSDKVYRYDGAASRLSGTQNAASSFNLNSGNTTPKDIVTDGASLWVVDDASKTDKVFKYSTSGMLVGSWTIDAANKAPTGIAIDPANVGDIWIADSGTDRVYRYVDAVNRNSGSQSAAASFALGSANKNPQGLAVAGRPWSEAPFEVQWVKQLGTPADDIGRAAAVDNAGRVVVSGQTNGSLSAVNPTGISTSYLAQFDSAGNLNWLEQPIPVSGDQVGLHVEVDSSGHSFQVVGGSASASLNKRDSAGVLEWSSPLTNLESAWGVAVDDLGHAYVSSYSGSLIFLRKYDGHTGAVLWTRTVDTGGTSTNSSSLSLDGGGNIYVVGYTYGALIGPSAGLADAIVIKFDTDGNQQWARQFGTAGYDFAFNIAADELGNVYVAGGLYKSIEALNAGNQDLFFTKLDSSGTVQWTRQLGTTANDWGSGLQTDGFGNLFFMGATYGALGGPHLGGSDIVLGKYSAMGELLWLQQYGTSGDEGGSGLTADRFGNLYVGTRSSGAWGGPNAGGYDAVLVKLSSPVAMASSSALEPLDTNAAVMAVALNAGVESDAATTRSSQPLRGRFTPGRSAMLATNDVSTLNLNLLSGAAPAAIAALVDLVEADAIVETSDLPALDAAFAAFKL